MDVRRTTRHPAYGALSLASTALGIAAIPPRLAALVVRSVLEKASQDALENAERALAERRFNTDEIDLRLAELMRQRQEVRAGIA